MINFDKLIELLLDKNQKSKQLLFLGTYGSIIDWMNKEFLELDFHKLVNEIELYGSYKDNISSEEGDISPVLLDEFFALNSLKFNLPRIEDYGGYRMGKTYNSIDPETYFVTLQDDCYKDFVNELINRLKKFWVIAKEKELSNQLIIPSSNYLKNVGKLFDYEFEDES